MANSTFIVLGENEKIVANLRDAFPRARIIPTTCLDLIQPLDQGPDTRILVDPRTVRSCCVTQLLQLKAVAEPFEGELLSFRMWRTHGVQGDPARAAWMERGILISPARLRGVARGFITTALEHDHEWFTVQEVADALGFSVRQLRRIIEKDIGYAPHVLLHLARIDSVAREILNSGTQLAAISLSHGFSDLPSMSRQFKRFVGTTPGRYRRRAAGTNVRTRQFRVAERAN